MRGLERGISLGIYGKGQLHPSSVLQRGCALSGRTFESYLIAHMTPEDSYAPDVPRMFSLKHIIPVAAVPETDSQFQLVLVFGDSCPVAA